MEVEKVVELEVPRRLKKVLAQQYQSLVQRHTTIVNGDSLYCSSLVLALGLNLRIHRLEFHANSQPDQSLPLPDIVEQKCGHLCDQRPPLQAIELLLLLSLGLLTTSLCRGVLLRPLLA